MGQHNKNILVHLHLYYHEQIDYMLSKLKNINNCNWDLYVTICQDNSISKKKILNFKPDAKIIIVENKGYDVWPFISIIKSVNLSNYDYIVKIHTKNYQKKPNALGKKGFWWRNELIDSLLKSKTRYKNNIKILEDNSIGMICSALMYRTVSGNKKIPEESFLLNKELLRLNFTTQKRDFCAGTMFIAKADIFKFLQTSQINANDFSTSESTSSVGTLAHVYERILCIAVSEYGYKIYPKVNKIEILKLLMSPTLKTPQFSFLKDLIFSYSIEKINNKNYNVLTILGYKFLISQNLNFENFCHKTAIPICLASDNNYMPYTYVTINSILSNKNKGTKYKFILLHPDDIEIHHKQNLNKLISKSLCEVEYINMKENFKEIKIQLSHISLATFYRLLLPNLLKNYDKCIWLDGDLIVLDDLEELYNTDINNYYLAGVKAPYIVVDNNYHKQLNIPSMDYYINAGVALWNLKLLRKEDFVNKFMRLLPNNYLMQDQDIMNVACYSKIKILPLKYNFMTKTLDLKQELIKYNVFSKQDFKKGVQNAKIIHYASPQKPWNSDCRYNKIWWKYAQNTPYYFKMKQDFNSKNHLSFFQKIFAIKNASPNKIIIILGLKIKIKSEKLLQKENINRLKTEFNSLRQEVENLKKEIEMIGGKNES